MNKPGMQCRGAHLAHNAIFFINVINPFPLFTTRWLEFLLCCLGLPNTSTFPQLLEVHEQASPTPIVSVLSVVFNAETLQATIACLSIDVSLQESAKS